MATKPDPQQHYHPEARDATDAAREARAVAAASDDDIINELDRRQGQHLASAPEATLEAELQRRGYVWDEERSGWVKS
jgi:hypothetical protein